MIDWILSQNCRNTLLLHIVDQLVCHAKNERLMWLAAMKCGKNSNLLQGLTFDCKMWQNKDLCAQSRTEKKNASQAVNK